MSRNPVLAPAGSQASPLPPASPSGLERRIVLLMAAVQFVNVLDFVIVMPLGPDFATGLGIPTSRIGWIAGSYTLAAALVGVLGSFFLDRFDRRRGLIVTLAGLAVGTLSCGLATGLGTLIAARLVAGFFGGPATAFALSIVTDSVPVRRRGRALGTVMAAFSVASVVGVPVGLEIAHYWDWRAAFFAVAALAVLVTATARMMMPSEEAVLASQTDADPVSVPPEPSMRTSTRHLLEPAALLALATTFVMTIGVFAVVPNLSTYVLHNLGYPREGLGFLYLVGGVASFATLRVCGRLVDGFRAGPVFLVGTIVHTMALWMAFLIAEWAVPVLVFFLTYMVSGSIRMVAVSTLSSRVPLSHQRAGFMSAQSALRHAGSALGSVVGAALLVSMPDGKLSGMSTVALLAIAAAWLALPLLVVVERKVLARAR